MTTTPDPVTFARLARILDARRDPQDVDERDRLAGLMRGIATGTADHDDPDVRETVAAVAFVDASPLGSPAVRDVADAADPLVIADILDRLAAHDRGSGGLHREAGMGPVVGPLLGAGADLPLDDLTRATSRAAGPATQWRHEMRQLFRASLLSDAELAAELHERGLDVPPHTVLEVPEDVRVAEAAVELLGARWIDDNFRTLYDAARREQEPGAVPAVQSRVSGLAGADAVDIATVGALIQPPLYDLPRVLGRQWLITRLVEGLDEPKRPTQVLVGPGGYGKSTIALATAQGAEDRSIVPMWVPASNVDALVDGLHRATIRVGATALDIQAALGTHGERRIARLWDLLDAAERRWLLVLDDAGPEAAGHPGWVHRSPSGTTVVTTRFGEPADWGPDAEVTSIADLTDDDGARVLLDRISIAGSRMVAGVEGQARRLSRLLAGMPLALTSVGSMLASHTEGRGLGELVERLQPAAAGTAVATTYRICLQSFDAADHLSARHLMRLLASFAPDEALPVHLLAGTRETNWRGRDGLAELVRVGLVEELPSHRREPRCVRLHPAVAEEARHDATFLPFAVQQIELRAIALLGAELDRLDADAPAAWLPVRRLEPHVARVVESESLVTPDQQTAALRLAERAAAALMHAGSHQAASTLLDRAFAGLDGIADDHPVRLAARHTRAWMLTIDGNGDLPAAEQALAAVLDDELRVLGDDHPDTLTTADAFAWVIAEQGRLDAARRRFADVLGRRTQILGADHPDTLTTRHRLAWVDALRGREAAVVDEFRSVLELRRARLGSDHMAVYATRYRLAWVLNKTGRHAEAEQHYRHLQRDLETVVGEQHPMTLIVRNRHAWTLASLDRFTDAKEVYRLLRVDQEKVLGAGHPRVLATRLAQARLALQEGRLSDAAPEFGAVVDRHREELGDTHPRTLESRTWHAQVLLASGRAGAADRGFRAVLADRVRLLGTRHPDTLLTRYLLGRALVRRGRLTEAEQELRALLDDERSLPLDERNTFPARHALARVVGLQGRYLDSEAGLRAVWADRTRLLGADHRRTMVTRDHLSWVLGRAGRTIEGLEICRTVLSDRRRVLGSAHPHSLASQYREAWLLELLGDIDAGRALLDALLPEMRRVLGEDHPHTLRCRAGLVRLARLTGDLNDAAVMAGRLVADQSRVQGPLAVETLRAREERGSVLLAQGLVETGREILHSVLDDRLRVLSDGHPDTAQTLVLLK